MTLNSNRPGPKMQVLPTPLKTEEELGGAENEKSEDTMPDLREMQKDERGKREDIRVGGPR